MSISNTLSGWQRHLRKRNSLLPQAMSDIDPALRDVVQLRTDGLCEYCRISERLTLAEHEIDHVIAIKHGGQTVAENLALCCAVCNRFKGSDIASIDPETGQLTPLNLLQTAQHRARFSTTV